MKQIKMFLLLLLLVVLGFSLYKINQINNELNSSQEIKEKLIELVEIPETPSDEPSFQVDFEELKKINSDVIGWIVIEGTGINYPIVQGNNNSFYLNHSYDKKWNSLGSIFADYQSSNDFSDYNTFIYGHHTRNGSMFGELYKYMDVSFYKQNRTFYLYTPTGNFTAEIFSAYIDSTDSSSYNQSFNSITEFNDYINLVKEKSNYSTDVKIDVNKDKIITLYSCSHESNRKKNDRYFIHAVLRKLS